MKTAIALLLIIGLGALAGWQKNESRVAAERSAEEIAELQAELKTAKGEIKELKGELANARKAAVVAPPVADKTPAPATVPSVASKPTQAPVAPPSVPDAPAVDHEAELARIDAIYETNRKAIDAKAATLDRNEAAAQAALAALESNPPQFSEQGDRLNNIGEVIGKKGVRTSEADRKRAMEDWNEKKAPLQAQIAAIATARADLEAERGKLLQAYDAAKSAALAAK